MTPRYKTHADLDVDDEALKGTERAVNGQLKVQLGHKQKFKR